MVGLADIAATRLRSANEALFRGFQELDPGFHFFVIDRHFRQFFLGLLEAQARAVQHLVGAPHHLDLLGAVTAPF